MKEDPLDLWPPVREAEWMKTLWTLWKIPWTSGHQSVSQNEGRSLGPVATGPWGRVNEDLVDPVEDPVDLWPPVRKSEWRKIPRTSGNRSVRQNEPGAWLRLGMPNERCGKRRWRRHGWWNRKQTNEFNKQTNKHQNHNKSKIGVFLTCKQPIPGLDLRKRCHY